MLRQEDHVLEVIHSEPHSVILSKELEETYQEHICRFRDSETISPGTSLSKMKHSPVPFTFTNRIQEEDTPALDLECPADLIKMLQVDGPS